MAVGYLNERTQKIINMMLNRSSASSIREIAEELEVSTRTVYNELDKANSWLRMKKLPELSVLRGNVQPFLESEKSKFETVMEISKPQDDYIFTPSERTKIIICQIISSDRAIYVEDLMNTCMVSRNTIFADLQAVISQLYSYQLELGYEKKKGYWIDGDPIRVRAIFFLYFSMLEPLLEMGKLHFLDMQKIDVYLEQLEKVEEELQVSYVQNDMLALVAILPLMHRDERHLYFPDLKTEKVRETQEYQLVKKYFSELSDMEKIYLTLHLLGGRLASYSNEEEILEEKNETVMEIAKNLVIEFERKACVVFEQKEDLIRDLYRHIAASIYRYRFGIQIGNPMAEDIRREYSSLFDITRSTVRYLEQQIGVQISDSEVAYLVLHFGAHLEYAKHDEKELRILVVCVNGVATGNMICHELKRILPQVNIVGVQSVSEIRNPQNLCDLIVSSVKLKTVVPVIVVNPILNDFDRRNILNHPLIRSKVGFVDMEALFHTIKKYVQPERYKELKNDLEKFFVRSSEERQPVLKPDIWRMTDFLTEDKIVFLNSDGKRRGSKTDEEGANAVEAWKRALYTTAEPLIERKSIDKSYVKCVIERLLECGPYMFVTKDLILAHARPENGVKHLDFSMGIAPDGVTFAEGNVARIVFLLVVEDQQKHIGILRDIRKALSKSEQIDELTECESSKEVCEIIWSRIHQV